MPKSLFMEPMLPLQPIPPQDQMNARYRWESAHRYYIADVHTDLFGDWVLARYWGGRDNRLGGQAQTLVASLASAQEALVHLDKTRRQRGYLRVA